MEETQDWLNDEFLRSVLTVSIADDTKDLTVLDYKAKRALEDGKNFASVMYKVNVSYKNNKDEIKKRVYMVKNINPSSRNWFGEKEEDTYKVLPIIEKYLSSKFAPLLHVHSGDLLVMEDLTDQGFQNANLKLLDYDHCVLALKALAKFHAGSILLHQNHQKLVEEIGREILINNPKTDPLGFFSTNMLNLGEEISTWPESQKYAVHFPIIAGKFQEYFENIPKRNTVRVLNHGDYWLNNMMFRYENGQVSQHRMVDFQMCRFAPPSVDFQYFMGTSPDYDVRHNRLDDLITVYLDTFNQALTDLGIPQRMSRQQFEEDLKEDYYMYFIGFCTPFCTIFADPEETFTFEGVDFEKVGSNMIGRLFKTKGLRKIVPSILDDLDQKGVFKRL